MVCNCKKSRCLKLYVPNARRLNTMATSLPFHYSNILIWILAVIASVSLVR